MIRFLYVSFKDTKSKLNGIKETIMKETLMANIICNNVKRSVLKRSESCNRQMIMVVVVKISNPTRQNELICFTLYTEAVFVCPCLIQRNPI